MENRSDSERRQFVRVSADLPVQYKFISVDPRYGVDASVHSGYSRNLSQGGLLLVGRLTNLNWISPLLVGRIALAVRLELPNDSKAIKAVCRTAWLETIEEKSQRAAYGLLFQEILRADQERILQFVLRSQI